MQLGGFLIVELLLNKYSCNQREQYDISLNWKAQLGFSLYPWHWVLHTATLPMGIEASTAATVYVCVTMWSTERQKQISGGIHFISC